MPTGAAGEPWLARGPDGEKHPADNPALAIPQPWHDFVALWARCRGEMGIAHWPDAGGVNAQAAWIVDAFSALSNLAAHWDAEQRTAEGRG